MTNYPEIDAPAPWQLKGHAYICLLKKNSNLLDSFSFIPDKLKDRLQPESHPIMMFVDYTYSPVGPYYELLFIPGRFRYENELHYLSISRIFVSTLNSVINGKKNWGIPKELADFNVGHDHQRHFYVNLSKEGKQFVELKFKSWPILLPFTTRLLPKTWRTFIQFFQGKTYLFQPNGCGLLRPASLVEAHINPEVFPAVNPEDIMTTVKVTNFKLDFPPARM